MPLVANYKYRTARGSVAFVKLRYEPKRFTYRWPNCKAAGAGSPRKLLYRLPELIHAESTETVFIAEGEKDCDALAARGLVATCNYDGAGPGKWQESYSRYFRGRNVVILPDNDRTGQSHAEDVASHLSGKARSVRILKLPGLAEQWKPVVDWERFYEVSSLGRIRSLHARQTSAKTSLKTWHSNRRYLLVCLRANEHAGMLAELRIELDSGATRVDGKPPWTGGIDPIRP